MLLGGRERVHWEQMGNSSTIENGISDNIFDLHNVSLDICKGPAKFRYDRSYNNYNKKEFENVLKPRLVSSSNSKEFFDTFLAILNKQALLKKIAIVIKSSWVKRFVKLS